jgi:hypothetical protein
MSSLEYNWNIINASWIVFFSAGLVQFCLALPLGLYFFAIGDVANMLLAISLLFLFLVRINPFIYLTIIACIGLMIKSIIFSMWYLHLWTACKGADSHLCSSDTHWTLFLIYYMISFSLLGYTFAFIILLYDTTRKAKKINKHMKLK